MMILNSSIGSNSNNVSLIQAAIGFQNERQQRLKESTASKGNNYHTNSNISSGVNSNYNSNRLLSEKF